MLGNRIGARNGLRWGVLGLASVALVALSNHSLQAAPYADIVLDANSGKVLHSTNPDAKRHPASLTKIMTLYLLFEQLEAGKLKLDSKLDVSENAADQSPTKLGLREGSTISVEDAIKGLITRSANDAAVVIAEALADDEEAFARLMTEKAHALGMTRTVYKNASGLPDDEQVTTARDQAILARAIQEHFPRYYKFFSTRSFSFRGQSIRNHNKLLGRVEGVDGIKTGYIRASGFNLVTSVHRGNRYVVAVVMGGSSGGSRDERMRELIGDYIGDASTKRTVPMIALPGAGPGPGAPAAVAAKAEVRPEPKAGAKPAVEPKAGAQREPMAAKPEPNAEPKAAAKSETKPDTKDQQRFAVASTGTTPARATGTTAASAQPVVSGSHDPIRPVMVKTVTVRAGITQTAALGPTTISMPVAPVAPAAPSAPTATAAAAPSAPVAAAKTETPPLPAPAARPAAVAALPAQRAAVATAEPAPSPKRSEANATAPAKPQVRSGWMIQVGAFLTDSDARQRLSDVQSKAAQVLSGTDPFTETVDKKGSTYYRARFAGFDKDKAEAACKFLKRNDVECVTIRN
jgi:D-alanyl-D-alanine carboxypeptidase